MSDVEPLSAGEEVQLANFLIALSNPPILSCEYRNWRGEVSARRFSPIEFWYGSTEWHPEPGLMLKALDYGKNAERDFRLADFNISTLRFA